MTIADLGKVGTSIQKMVIVQKRKSFK